MEQITVNSTPISYTVEGNPASPPLILMHGWGCTHSTVESIARTAAATHRVYNIDLPGFGESPEPTTVWGVEEYTAAIEEFCRQLSLSSPTLIGHSFGGRISILFASRNDVDKVILVDAAGVKPKRKLSYYFKVYTYKLKKYLARLLLGKNRAETYLNKARAKAGSSDYANASVMMRRILSKVVNEDLKSVMPSIKAPTLLIWGTADTATPLSDAKTMERLIPGSGLVTFPGASHYSFLDRPGQFAAVLSSFLNS